MGFEGSAGRERHTSDDRFGAPKTFDLEHESGVTSVRERVPAR